MNTYEFRVKILLLILFGVAMAYLEAAVVVYLRELYYPHGFHFPIRRMPLHMYLVEIGRELATIVMLVVVARLAAKKLWERFGFFVLLFGIWDIFYYVWLKVTINWPSGLTDWDVLFLIPGMWVGPVIAPVLVSAVMILAGLGITRLFARGIDYRPNVFAWVLAVPATLIILYTFFGNSGVSVEGGRPDPYQYHFLIAGLAFYLAAFIHSYGRSIKASARSKQGRSQ